MAIVNMKKLSVIALRENEKDIVDFLMKMGVTQVDDISEEQIAEEYDGLLEKQSDSELLSEYDAQMKTVKDAIDILAAYVNVKKVLFAPRRSVSKSMYREVVDGFDKELAFAERVCAASARGREIKTEQNRLQNEIESLTRWEKLPFSLGYKGTKNTGVMLGTVPVSVAPEELSDKFEEENICAYAEELSADKDFRYIYILYHKSSEETLGRIMAQFGFSMAAVSGDDTPVRMIVSLKGKIEALSGEAQKKIDELREMAEEKAKLEILYDYISECAEKQRALDKLACTQSTVMLKGWVPAEAADTVAKALEKNFLCETETEAPSEEEAYPILLRNPKIVQPFETVTEMYSLPAPHSMDPNKLMAPFFFLFFGMMVSDAGYGLVLTLATAFILWKYKPQGQAKQLMGLICLGGISTMIWGAIFGGYFGDTIQVAVKLATGKEITIPSLMNPSADPISVLILSLILGLIHLFAGMGAKAYLLIKRGHVWDAVFDVGFWYLVLGGLGIVCLGFVMPGTPVTQIGMWTAIAGAVGLILTQGREKKNIFAKLIGGIGSLYDVVSYLSDLLSYSRLLALGLSTGVVASVINTMGSMGGNNIGGWILFFAVFIVGHLFNIAINTLGAYVHASRLQYVEFFGKFYESGGKAFKPLVRPAKYTQVVEDAGING